MYKHDIDLFIFKSSLIYLMINILVYNTYTYIHIGPTNKTVCINKFIRICCIYVWKYRCIVRI